MYVLSALFIGGIHMFGLLSGLFLSPVCFPMYSCLIWIIGKVLVHAWLFGFFVVAMCTCLFVIFSSFFVMCCVRFFHA